MTKAKYIIYSLALCFSLSIITFWFIFAYLTFDSAWFDYKTYGSFWLRTSIDDFFSGYWQQISSPDLYKQIYNNLKNTPVNLIIMGGLSIALLLIYFGLALKNKKKILVLGSVLWVVILTISLYI